MDTDVLALFIINELTDEDEEKSRRRKRRRTRMWIQDKEKYSNGKLLKTLRETEPLDFKNYMRMDDASYDYLLQRVSVYIQKQDTPMKEAISAERRLSITLRFLATGNCYEDLKFSSAVSAQSIGRIVMESCEAIIKVLKEFIKVPSTAEEWLNVAQNFYAKSKFPHCLGALDGKHIHITKPANSGSFYFNYKKTFSIVLMAIADSNSEFLMVDVGANGRISDGGVFANTKFFQKMQNDELNLPQPQSVILGKDALPYVIVADGAFSLRPNVMKPFAHGILSSEEILYNKRLSSARVKIENAFGILTARFRVLRTTINIQPEKAGIIVLACCYLHNFLRRRERTLSCASSDNFEELMSLETTAQKNPSNEAKAIRRQFCETIIYLNSLSPV